MAVTYEGKKPGALWYMRKRTGAFLAACKDSSTKHIARVMRRDALISTGSFATTGLLLKVSATAITSFIMSTGTPIAIGAGLLMGAKSYLSYRKAARAGGKSTHVRDGLLAVGAIGVGVLLINTAAAATVATVIGFGVPATVAGGALFAFKSWRGSRQLSNSLPASRYMRAAEQSWVDKKERGPFIKRLGASIGNGMSALGRALTAPLRMFAGKGSVSNDNTADSTPDTTAQGSAPALTTTSGEDFAKAAEPAVDPARAEAAAARAAAREARKRNGEKRFHS